MPKGWRTGVRDEAQRSRNCVFNFLLALRLALGAVGAGPGVGAHPEGEVYEGGDGEGGVGKVEGGFEGGDGEGLVEAVGGAVVVVVVDGVGGAGAADDDCFYGFFWVWGLGRRSQGWRCRWHGCEGSVGFCCCGMAGHF